MAKLDAYFGEYGGQYVPQILVPALDQLEQAFILLEATISVKVRIAFDLLASMIYLSESKFVLLDLQLI